MRQRSLLPPICPILISQNGFFASEIMGGKGGGLAEYRSAGGRNRSLVACVSPVQLRFSPYTKVREGPSAAAVAPPNQSDAAVE